MVNVHLILDNYQQIVRDRISRDQEKYLRHDEDLV